MIQIRLADERGRGESNWLQTRYSFSFAEYQDPNHMGFRTLRVINQDIIQPDSGFATHPHRDMEIITYMIRGTIQHEDSMGNKTQISEGEIQRMTAGTGVTHSEYNPSKTEPLELLQIWILPEKKGLEPGYEQVSVSARQDKALSLIISPKGEQGSLKIHQDARVYRGVLAAGQAETQPMEPNRYAWIQVVRGELSLNHQLMNVGDGAQVSEESQLEFLGKSDSEFLLFDLA